MNDPKPVYIVQLHGGSGSDRILGPFANRSDAIEAREGYNGPRPGSTILEREVR